MKTIKLATLTIATIISANTFAGKPTTFKIDTQKSNLGWEGKKVTGMHNGNIALGGGTIELDGKNIKSGNFSIDMTSITCSDLKDAGYNKNLVDHLKADDFFGVEKFNTATFEIKKAVKKGKQTMVTGNLTIKGITNEITIPVAVANTKNSLVLIGTTVIDRTKFGIKYGSKNFIENLGDKAISDDFTLAFKLVASN